MSVLSAHMLSAGDAEVSVIQMGSLPKNPSVQGSPRLLPPLSWHAASLAILTTHISCHAHTTDECTSYRSDTRVEDALCKSRASPPPLTFVLIGPPRFAHRARYLPHPLMMIVLALLFLPTPPAPLTFRPPCLSSSLLTELLLLLAHPAPSTLHYYVDCLVD
jgi:hypothetical protein